MHNDQKNALMLTRSQRIAKWTRRARLTFRNADRPAQPVFVFGSQRSGTNVTLEVIGKCPETEVYPENDDEAYVNYRLRSHAEVDKLIQRSRAKVVVFKPIADSQNARRILTDHRNGLAIWVYRHYSDVVNSALREFSEHRKYLYYMLNDPRTADWRVEGVPTETMNTVQRFHGAGVSDASARALIWWIRNQHFFLQELQSRDDTRLLRYESMVQKPNEVFKEIFDFLSIPFHRRLIRSIHGMSLAKHPPQDIDPEIRALCEACLDKLNFYLSCQK